jgi:hypothetical protein
MIQDLKQSRNGMSMLVWSPARWHAEMPPPPVPAIFLKGEEE